MSSPNFTEPFEYKAGIVLGGVSEKALTAGSIYRSMVHASLRRQISFDVNMLATFGHEAAATRARGFVPAGAATTHRLADWFPASGGHRSFAATLGAAPSAVAHAAACLLLPLENVEHPLRLSTVFS